MKLTDRDIYFEIDGALHRLPVLPETLSFQVQAGTVLSETVKLGEISILRDRKLIAFSIPSFFPRYADRGYIRTRDDFKEPEHYIELFMQALSSKKPLNFIVTGLPIKPFYVSIDNFEHAYPAQDEDVSYILTLREYKHYGKSGKELDKQEPLFDGDETKAYEAVKSMRPKSGYAIGDRVIVNGAYYQNPWGGAPLARLPLQFMTSAPKSLVANAAALLKSAKHSTLSQSECIIVGLELSINTALPSLFRYQIADAATRRALGWVAEASLAHKT